MSRKKQMIALLYDVEGPTIDNHLKKVFEDSEILQRCDRREDAAVAL